jgi:hypothetical protein
MNNIYVFSLAFFLITTNLLSDSDSFHDTDTYVRKASIASAAKERSDKIASSIYQNYFIYLNYFSLYLFIIFYLFKPSFS